MNRIFKTLSTKKIYTGRALKLEKLTIRTPDKSIMSRELIRHPGASVVIPVLDDGSLLLVYQYRAAVNGYILEFPAGTLEPKEKPIVCARREVEEETGYKARTLKKIGMLYPAPGISTECMYLFVAHGLRKGTLNLDHDEWLELRQMRLSELKKMIGRREILDAKTVVSFYYYLEYLKQ